MPKSRYHIGMKKLGLWLYLGLVLFKVSGCSTATPTKNLTGEPILKPVTIDKSVYYLHEIQSVNFLGQPSRDNKMSSAGGMAYPGYDAASFAAGIIVHALFQGGANAKKERKKQEAFNAVLSPYRDYINQLDASEICPNVIHLDKDKGVKLIPGKNPVNNIYSVAKAEPVYWMNQDASRLTLVNKIHFSEGSTKTISNTQKRTKSRSKNPTKPKGEPHTVVHYTYAANTPDENSDYWATDGYQPLENAIQLMFEQSMRLAFQYQDTKSNAGITTLKYFENGQKRVERGRLIRADCNRMEFISLSGIIKSVPLLDHRPNCDKALPI